MEKARASYKKWAADNKQYSTKRKLVWAKDNPEKSRKADRDSYYKNKQTRLAKQKEYVLANKDKIKKQAKEWRLANMGYVLAKNKEREVAKKNRVPKWLTKEDFVAIKKIYDECRKLNEMGGSFHVDHEIPLQGATVSGLHTPSNLRILSALDNCKKKNHFSGW